MDTQPFYGAHIYCVLRFYHPSFINSRPWISITELIARIKEQVNAINCLLCVNAAAGASKVDDWTGKNRRRRRHLTCPRSSDWQTGVTWPARCPRSRRDGFQRQQEAAEGRHGLSDGEYQLHQAADQGLVQRIHGTHAIVQLCLNPLQYMFRAHP